MRTFPLIFTYNSHTNTWTHTLNVSLTLDATGAAIVRDADGTAHLFRREANGSYTAPAGNYDTLVHHPDQTFTLTHPDQSAHLFDASGRLTQVRDRNGNAINLTYTNNVLTQAQAAGGQTLTFAYSGGNLASVTDHAGRAFQFGYTSGALTSITDPMNLVTRFGYTNNRLTMITDARNTVTTIAYDVSNRAQMITTAGVRLASFAYGAGTTTFTDANNNATVYTLNATGQVTQVRDALSGLTTFTYDANYNLTQTTDALGRTTRVTYDARGNRLTQTDALNQTTTYTYNATNDLLSVTDPLGRTTQYGYDAAGNLIRITDALNNVTTYGYDAYGQRTRATDANNNTTLYTYNSAGYLVSTTDALNNVTQYGYDAVGDRTSVTDALNRTTTYAYDANNRLTQINALLGATTRYEYDANSNRTAMVDALNQRTTFTYDAFNRQTAVTDALNQTTQYQYDANGNRTRVIDANGNATNYQYDALNRLIRVTDALNYVTQYQYDAVGNRTSTIDARGNTTTSTYDALNRVTAVTIPITGTTTGTTRYEYDAVGNRTRVTDANNNATNYQYDALNRVTRVTDAQGNATQYAYDAVGNRMSITDAANQTTTYAYDALNRVTTITNPSGKTQTFTYDAVGNRLTATDEISQTTRYSYDALNRVISVTDPLTQTTMYAYNAVGNVTTITNPVGQITTLSYDAANRLVRKTTPLGATQYTYDAVGNLRVLTDPSSATTTYTYDAVNRVIQQDDRAPDGALTVSYAFAYDADGNRTQETEARPGKPYRMMNYAYNKANWLVATTDPGGGTTTYNYDAAGNRTSVTDPSGYSTSITPNAVNQPQTTIHRNASGVVAATTTNTYDAHGFLRGWTTVDALNTLTLTTTLDYNANGYLTRNDASHQGTLFSRSFTSTVAYRDNNLVTSIFTLPTPTDRGYRQVVYDSAGRVICFDSGAIPADAYLEYDASGRRIKRYWNYYGDPSCQSIIANPTGNPLYKRSIYTYAGDRLISEEATYGGGAFYSRTLSYDSAGNVTQMRQIDYDARITVTLTYNWEPGSHRMTGVTREVNGSVQYTATLEYDRNDRITRFCASNTGCFAFAYVGETDWLSTVTDQYGTVTQRYLYANGRPLRVDINGAPNYYRYNWHGDVAGVVWSNGDGASQWAHYGAWGDLYNAGAGYYHWNGGWGYMKFPSQFNFNLHEGLDIGLYYVHGRWYNPDTGLFLSPDENGEYVYHDNDAVNYAQVQGASEGYPRDYFVNLAGWERMLLNLRGTSLATFGEYWAKYIPAMLAAHEAVGEVANMCQPTTLSSDCRRAFGAIALVIQNRYDYCQSQSWCPFSRYGLPSHPTRSEIIVADCAQGLCRQFEGLEHWIRIETGQQMGKCNATNPSDCYHVGQQGRQRQISLAFDAALDVFSGRYKTDPELSLLDQDIGKRVYFGGSCGGTRPPTPIQGQVGTPSPTATPGPTQCKWISYANHFFWGP
jgi:YD repeat-containing protein